MDEENKTPTETPAQEGASDTATNNDKGIQLPAGSIINRAEAVEEKLSKLVKQDTENLDRREALMVSDRLGGRTEAGQSQDKQLTPEQKATNERINAYGKATGSSWADKNDK